MDECPESSHVDASTPNDLPGPWQMALEAYHKETRNHPKTGE